MGEIIKTTLLGDAQWKQLKVRHTSLSAIRPLARLSPQSVAIPAKGQLGDDNWLPHLDVPR